MSKNVRHFIILFLLITGLPWYGAAQQAAPYRLTLRDALEKRLQANLSVLVADTQVQEAEGARTRRLSAALLPRVRAGAGAGELHSCRLKLRGREIRPSARRRRHRAKHRSVFGETIVRGLGNEARSAKV